MATPLMLLAIFTVPIVAMAANQTSTTAPSVITFIFGDSLTEVGNNNYLSYSLARSDFPFYGIDYINQKPTGRFSNGRTISDIISEKLGIPSPPPYLSLNHDDDAVLNGVNYASGGAGILNETGIYFIQRMSFDDQIDYFENTTEVIKVKIGEQAANSLLQEAIYFIAMGSNDYINNFLQPFLPDSQRYTHGEFLGILNLKLAEQLTRLYLLGARKMIFIGLGPLGCIPSQRAKSSTNQCLHQVNEWAIQFNSKVQKLVNVLNVKLKNAQITFADTYQDGIDMVENPSKYGKASYLLILGFIYTNNKLSRYGKFPKQRMVTLLYGCLWLGFKVSNTSCCKVETTVGGLCLSYARVCDNRSEYVFWDAFHPSDAANVVLADRFFAKLFVTSNSSTNSSSYHMG